MTLALFELVDREPDPWSGLADLGVANVLPAMIYPGKVPAAGQPHWLVVHEHPDDGFEVEHTDDCLGPYGNVACDVVFHEEDGLDLFFHRPDLGEDGTSFTDGVRPGRYLIESWFEEHYSYFYGSTEYDAGLCLIYPEEAE
ncbi:hypothetical protein AB0D08_00310 [Kitasatospora sp. NPDC048540]|uniref:hypothetical protein n=1 Tax=Kitasatospora sp. NPDC048540 TaxID=3155634 RepID=UPI003403F230